MVDITRATEVAAEGVEAAIEELFTYHPWDEIQKAKGQAVRKALAAAVKVIVEMVPPCATRTIAIRELIAARMQCNAAITNGGAF